MTFIVPVYNTAEYLSQCLNSIIAQNVRKEIIAVDDGSTDTSGQILAEFAASYPFIRILTQQNQGVSAARNAGLRAAKGRYVQFVDSDDYLLAGCAYQTYIQHMQEHGVAMLKAPAVWEQSEIVPAPVLEDTSKAFVEIYKEKQGRSQQLEIAGSEKFVEALAKERFLVELWAYIFDIEYLRRQQLHFDETLTHGEDLYFVVQALTAAPCKIMESSEIVYYYRYRQNSAMNKANDAGAVAGFIKTKNAMLRYILHADLTPQMRINTLILGFCCLNNITGKYFTLDPNAKQSLNDHFTLDLYGLFEFFNALCAQKRGTAAPSWAPLRQVFRQTF
nr:glycosyltransferase [Neisseria animalis]